MSPCPSMAPLCTTRYINTIFFHSFALHLVFTYYAIRRQHGAFQVPGDVTDETTVPFRRSTSYDEVFETPRTSVASFVMKWACIKTVVSQLSSFHHRRPAIYDGWWCVPALLFFCITYVQSTCKSIGHFLFPFEAYLGETCSPHPSDERVKFRKQSISLPVVPCSPRTTTPMTSTSTQGVEQNQLWMIQGMKEMRRMRRRRIPTGPWHWRHRNWNQYIFQFVLSTIFIPFRCRRLSLLWLYTVICSLPLN